MGYDDNSLLRTIEDDDLLLLVEAKYSRGLEDAG